MTCSKIALQFCVLYPILLFTQCSDRVIYDVSTEPQCTEITQSATGDCRWHAGLDRTVDHKVLGGKIVAYKIRSVEQSLRHNLIT